MKIKHPVDTKKRRDMAIRFLKRDATLADVTRYLKVDPYSGRNMATLYICRALQEAHRMGEVTISP